MIGGRLNGNILKKRSKRLKTNFTIYKDKECEIHKVKNLTEPEILTNFLALLLYYV